MYMLKKYRNIKEQEWVNHTRHFFVHSGHNRLLKLRRVSAVLAD